ncbi:MAG: hypothetical protein NTY15_11140 [Planctomycetota bacterium]|nr:hypothetical protein [Planctomycetota bacterium]
MKSRRNERVKPPLPFPVSQDDSGDKLQASIPKEQWGQVSKAFAKWIEESDANAVIQARILMPTSRVQEYLSEGPFVDGCFQFQIEGTISKAMQNSLSGTGVPFIGFCPAFECFAKNGPCFRICFQASEETAECILGIGDAAEPWNAEVFRTFVNDVGLSPIFPA